jgi:hypothetical protein
MKGLTMADIRKGDMLDMAGGTAEVLSVVANNEGGLDVSLRYAASKEELSRTVYRKGGPDEREEDKDTHSEDYEDEFADDWEDDFDEDDSDEGDED